MLTIPEPRPIPQSVSQVVDPAQKPEEEEEFSILDFFAVLWRRRIFVVGLSAIVAIFSVVYAAGSLLLPPEKSYMPNVYTPKATMLIDAPNSGSLSSILTASSLGGLASMAGVSTKGNPNGTIATILASSNTTLDTLNEKYSLTERYKITKKVKSETRKAILSSLTVKFDDKTNIFTLAFSDRDPVLAQSIVNSAVEIIAARFATLGGNRALNQKKLLETKLAEVEISIDRLESDVKNFQSKYGVTNVEALAAEQITVVARLRSELILKDMEIANYEKISRIDDPIIKRLKDERIILNEKIKELEVGKSSASTSGKVIPSQKELPEIAFEYSRLQRDLLVQTEVFKLLTQQYEMAKLNAIGVDPIFQIMELAEAPDTKSGPSRAKLVVSNTLIAFFLAILMVFLFEAYQKFKSDPKAVARFKVQNTKKVVKQ